jgi:ubiquinone/menaquinone biosynthesis C-methylase UbiE
MSEAKRAGLAETLQQPTIHEIWEQGFRTEASERFYEMACDWLVAHGGLKPEGRLLDAGCGIAQHSLRWARRGFSVEAVDVSADRVARARDNIASAGLGQRVQVSQGDLTAGLRFPPESFDVVFCWGVLMHIPDIETALRELVRLVRPGGHIVIGESTTFSVDTLATFWRTKLIPVAGRQMTRTEYGREYWTRTPGGSLFVRHSSPRSLRRFFERNGFRLNHRVAGQFTELFTRVPARAAFLLHAWNAAWFRLGAMPWLACGNIFVFERTK